MTARGTTQTTHTRTKSPPRHLGVPVEVRRRGASLLNQQCWCWGCDVRRADGNLLLEYGFRRFRVPQGQRGSSAYTLHIGPGESVVLWGFGLFYGHESLGGLYLPRAGFEPRLLDGSTPPAQVWEWQQLASARSPQDIGEWLRAHRLLAFAMRWIAGYERWVIATHGESYRQACVSAWRKNGLSAAQMAETWTQLAQRCAARALEIEG
jgi:hypothetical protein